MKSVRTLAAVALTALSINAQAVSMPTDGSWVEFDFDAAGSSIYDLSSLETAFTFSLAQNSVLRVVDLGFSGDQFRIFANGNQLGLTSVPVADFSNQVFDASDAFANNNYSRGSWNLAAGTYSITGLTELSPVGGGYAAMSVTAVPEPDSWAMMGLGLGLMSVVARRRINSTL
jgi:hypothetical protein